MTGYGKAGIIGLGRLGSSLLKALDSSASSGIRTYTRSGSAKLSDLVENCGTVFVCVNDDSLEEIAEMIVSVAGDLSGKAFIHFSGLKTSAVFKSLKAKGAVTASLHPLQTFPTKESQENFKDILFALEGDDVERLIIGMFAHLRPRIVRIDASQKTRYHAAAVFSSNLFCVLCRISDRLLKEAGIGEGIKIHESLIKTTVDGILKYGPDEALTGPAVRGDLSTLKQHLEVLCEKEAGIYISLSAEALRTGAELGKIGDEKRMAVEKELFRKDIERDVRR